MKTILFMQLNNMVLKRSKNCSHAKEMDQIAMSVGDPVLGSSSSQKANECADRLDNQQI